MSKFGLSSVKFQGLFYWYCMKQPEYLKTACEINKVTSLKSRSRCSARGEGRQNRVTAGGKNLEMRFRSSSEGWRKEAKRILLMCDIICPIVRKCTS